MGHDVPYSAGGRARKRFLFSSLLPIALVFFATFSCGGSSGTSSATPTPTGQWTLSWSDDFSGSSNSLPDSSKWNIVVSGSGFGNNELEYYTNRTSNVHVENGNLVITAVAEQYTGTDGVTRSYTSARMNTAVNFTQKYGKFEARMKLPKGQGLWPAFWLLGDNYETAGWPQCGEIDIMENIGSNMSAVLGTLHGPGYSGSSGLTSTFTLPSGQQFSDDFHIFTVEWEPNVVRFYVDGSLYKTRTPSDLPSGASWVFDHPFYIILNLAVGGNLPGSPDASTQFPQSMLIDYVRVYSR